MVSGFEIAQSLRVLANATHEIQAMEDFDGAPFAVHQVLIEANVVTARFVQHTVRDGKPVSKKMPLE